MSAPAAEWSASDEIARLNALAAVVLQTGTTVLIAGVTLGATVIPGPTPRAIAIGFSLTAGLAGSIGGISLRHSPLGQDPHETIRDKRVAVWMFWVLLFAIYCGTVATLISLP